MKLFMYKIISKIKNYRNYLTDLKMYFKVDPNY